MNLGKKIKGVLIGSGLVGLGSSALAAYNPVYQTGDLGTAIIDLLVTIVVSIARQGGVLGQLLVVILVVSLIGGVFTVIIGLVGTAMGMFRLFDANKPLI